MAKTSPRRRRREPVPILDRPRTAYRLLREIRTLIRAEPQRLHMGLWLVQGPRPRSGTVVNGLRPACGTVACLSGWVATLTRGPETHLNAFHRQDRPPEVIGAALLGVSEKAASDLFFYEPQDAIGWDLTPGTPAYVTKTIRHLNDWMARHEADLKAKRVYPGELDWILRGYVLSPPPERSVV